MTIAPRRQPGKTPPRATDPRFTGLLAEARGLQPRTVALRRSVHRHPERGLALPATQAAVLRALEGLPVRVTTGTSLSSVVAVLDGVRPGPTVLLRGDMDALPIMERTGLAFSSENPGTMHACGHDTHVAMLASAARLLAGRRDALNGQVVLMFQPGEEGHHGAEQMLAEGLLKHANNPIERALALHITANVRTGALATRPGPMMASSDSFTVLVTGKGGHGALPHRSIDPVPPAAEMVGALQTMLSRRVAATDPVVLTVGRITAGTTTNVIPETAELAGTIRTLSEPVRQLLHEELRRVCEHVGAAHGCQVDVRINPGYAVTVNDEMVGRHVLQLADDVLGSGHAELMATPMMGAEDFGYVLQRVPGALAFLGACPPGVDPDDAAPNHSDRVVFDESAMEHGVAFYAAFALDALR
jgi:hippurate hydrolase